MHAIFCTKANSVDVIVECRSFLPEKIMVWEIPLCESTLLPLTLRQCHGSKKLPSKARIGFWHAFASAYTILVIKLTNPSFSVCVYTLVKLMHWSKSMVLCRHQCSCSFFFGLYLWHIGAWFSKGESPGSCFLRKRRNWIMSCLCLDVWQF